MLKNNFVVETKDDDGTQPFVQDETSNDSDSFPWILSPLVQALSPLPPSPMPCRMVRFYNLTETNSHGFSVH